MKRGRKPKPPELKLTPPPAPKKKVKAETKKWSGTWVETETTRIDRKSGGKLSVAKVKANLTDEVKHLKSLFDAYEEAEIVTQDGSRKAFGAFVAETSKPMKAGKPGSVITVTLEGSGSFEPFVGRNVTLKGRQKKIEHGEHMGEPR